MADDQQAEQVVEETPQAPTPSADQTPESQTEEVETSEQETEPTQEKVKPRTEERIKKLTQDLRAEREARLRIERTTPAIPEWYDPSTGIVDPNKLQMREQTLISQLQTLQQQVQGYTRQQEAQQEKEAYAAYPELKTDDELHERVIREMATEFALGNSPTMKEAADKLLGFAKKYATKGEKEGARKALEQLAPKEQASLEATGRSDRRTPSVDLGQLSRQSRYGGDAGTLAVLQRLKNIPSV